MRRPLRYSDPRIVWPGVIVLVAISIAIPIMLFEANERTARKTFEEAGYKTVSMHHDAFGFCTKDRMAFVINTENESHVKACVGGFMKPSLTIIPR